MGGDRAGGACRILQKPRRGGEREEFRCTIYGRMACFFRRRGLRCLRLLSGRVAPPLAAATACPIRARVPPRRPLSSPAAAAGSLVLAPPVVPLIRYCVPSSRGLLCCHSLTSHNSQPSGAAAALPLKNPPQRGARPRPLVFSYEEVTRGNSCAVLTWRHLTVATLSVLPGGLCGVQCLPTFLGSLHAGPVVQMAFILQTLQYKQTLKLDDELR